jgi:hypothetical protein
LATLKISFPIENNITSKYNLQDNTRMFIQKSSKTKHLLFTALFVYCFLQDKVHEAQQSD